MITIDKIEWINPKYLVQSFLVGLQSQTQENAADIVTVANANKVLLVKCTNVDETLVLTPAFADIRTAYLAGKAILLDIGGHVLTSVEANFGETASNDDHIDFLSFSIVGENINVGTVVCSPTDVIVTSIGAIPLDSK